MSFLREKPEEWATWWVLMWLVISVALLALPFTMIAGFEEWAYIAAPLFGIPEAIGVWSKGDRFPPLTFVTGWYVPTWATVTAVGFFVGAIGGQWLGYQRPWAVGGLLGLAFWALDHFQLTGREVGRYRRRIERVRITFAREKE